MLAALAAACSTDSGEQFTVEGRIDGITNDTTLLFEALTIEGDVTLDSARLTADKCTFSFHAARPANPEFYRLRIENELLNLCIDSTESVTINATLGRMATDYSVTGSEKCEQLRLMSIQQQLLRANINILRMRKGMSPSQRRDSIDNCIEAYKQMLIKDFIAPDPSSAVAYSALFQTFGDTFIFNPVANRQDVRWMAAAATAWDMLYPGTARTENLHNVALQGLAFTTPARRDTTSFDPGKIHETGLIDFTMLDANGQKHSLSDLYGKVVLLDFTAYSLPEHNKRILYMRDIYSHYASRGLEIFQVSLDADRHFWATMTDQLPWVCVYCEGGTGATPIHIYNVQSLPTFFLIDRENNLRLRSDFIDDMEAEIKKLLDE